MIRRLLALGSVLYVGLAVRGLLRERRGELVCRCTDGCWCKRPPQSLFRWVFPYGHALRP